MIRPAVSPVFGRRCRIGSRALSRSGPSALRMRTSRPLGTRSGSPIGIAVALLRAGVRCASGVVPSARRNGPLRRRYGIQEERGWPPISSTWEAPPRQDPARRHNYRTRIRKSGYRRIQRAWRFPIRNHRAVSASKCVISDPSSTGRVCPRVANHGRMAMQPVVPEGAGGCPAGLRVGRSAASPGDRQLALPVHRRVQRLRAGNAPQSESERHQIVVRHLRHHDVELIQPHITRRQSCVGHFRRRRLRE